MADGLTLGDGIVVEVITPEAPVFEVAVPDGSTVPVLLVPGPPGPPSDSAGQPRYNGDGPPPAVIVGSQPGDLYLDVTSGLIYRLT